MSWKPVMVMGQGAHWPSRSKSGPRDQKLLSKNSAGQDSCSQGRPWAHWPTPGRGSCLKNVRMMGELCFLKISSSVLKKYKKKGGRGVGCCVWVGCREQRGRGSSTYSLFNLEMTSCTRLQIQPAVCGTHMVLLLFIEWYKNCGCYHEAGCWAEHSMFLE